MKLVTLSTPKGLRAGVLGEGGPIDLHRYDSTIPNDLSEVIAAWPRVADQVAKARDEGQATPGARLAAPLPNPRRILCIGLNYADHARESGVEPPSEPVVFNKLAGTVVGPDAEVAVPAASGEVDFEAELVAVIGRPTFAATREEASAAVFGYCCGHDVSARDWQLGRPGKQWLLGKSFPGFAPIGPYLVTADEVGDPLNLGIRLRLNGELMQDSRTEQLIYSPAAIVSHISQVCELEPGDLIFTGTPPGVGMARRPPRYLQPGDVTEVEIDGLGVLTTSFVAPS